MLTRGSHPRGIKCQLQGGVVGRATEVHARAVTGETFRSDPALEEQWKALVRTLERPAAEQSGAMSGARRGAARGAGRGRGRGRGLAPSKPFIPGLRRISQLLGGTQGILRVGSSRIRLGADEGSPSAGSEASPDSMSGGTQRGSLSLSMLAGVGK